MLLLFFLIILGFFVWLLLRVRKLEDELARLRAQFSAGAPAPPVSQPAIVIKPPEAATSPAAVTEPPQPPPTVPDAVSVPAPKRGSSFEEMLTVRWAVWAGGVALALAGVFLVRYSIDQGWLGPAARVSLGLLLGALLVAVSERARRHPTLVAAAAGGVTYVAPALAAAGLVAGFASVYAAYALYGFLNPRIAR